MSQEKPYRDFSYISAGRFAAIILQGMFYLLFAAMLGPESYGHLNVIIALAGTFSVFSRFGLHHSLQIYKAKKNSIIASQIITLFIITTSISSLILLSIDPLAAVLSMAISFYLLYQHDLLGLRQYRKFMFISILKNSLTLIVPLILYFLLDIPGIILGMAIASFIATIPFVKEIRIKSFFDLKNYQKVLISNFGVDAAGALPVYLDKLLIAPLFGFLVVGIYQFNLQILFVLAALPGVLRMFLLTEEASGITHRKMAKLVVLGSVALTALSIVLAPSFVNEFFPKYSEGIPSLQIILLTALPLSVGAIFSARLMANESTKIGYSVFIKLPILLVLLGILGNVYGLIGLSLAYLISTIINTTFLFILYKKMENESK